MKKILLLIFLFTAPYLSSQDSKKLWGGIEIGYGISLSDDGDSYNTSYGSENKMAISSIRGVIGYYIIPELSLGAGVGLNSYTKPGVNILPVWFDIRYHPFTNKKIQLNGDLGYTVVTSESKQKGKLLTDLSIGYKLFNFKRISLQPAIGYNFCNYSIEETKRFNQSRHSLFLKISILF
ncbi:hypothetical protein [Bacteroides sp. 51]|uniref:hypothetical protein n=1 Tax=Bacteroides sp. 51 TaxID=2302938 RepID=UPI0013D23A20|nr:hypothetical protein [Bacteroides sp. 51]NDV82447.1 hypothetical protein [Bacteroides sp. 51]